MRTVKGLIVALLVAGTFSGCSSDATTSPVTIADRRSDDAIVAPDDTGGADASTAGTTAAAPMSGDEPAVNGLDPSIVALANADAETFCATAPLAELEVMTGVAITSDPIISHIEGLSTDCAWYADDGGSLTTIAELQISPYAWSFIVDNLDTGGGAPAYSDCVVVERRALCQEAYDNTDTGLHVPASIYVRLGGDDDYALYAASDLGIGQAQAIAVLAINNIPVV